PFSCQACTVLVLPLSSRGLWELGLCTAEISSLGTPSGTRRDMRRGPRTPMRCAGCSRRPPPPTPSRHRRCGCRLQRGRRRMRSLSTQAGSMVATTLFGFLPSGLWHRLCEERAGNTSFLLLDTGHRLDVARAVLRGALRWLLQAHPTSRGRIVLAGFSMGSAAIADVLIDFSDAICGMIIVAGQASGVEGLAHVGQRPVLLVHGDKDPMVNVACAEQSAKVCRAAGAQVVLAIFRQVTLLEMEGDPFAKMQRHHLWDERWDVRNVVVEWLGRLCPVAARRTWPEDVQSMFSFSGARAFSAGEGLDPRPVLAAPRLPDEAVMSPERPASQACAANLRAAAGAGSRPVLALPPSHDDAASLLVQAASQACSAWVGEDERALAERR
ncbi:unnamed protein product, partial [Prorocentrum cordatum]